MDGEKIYFSNYDFTITPRIKDLPKIEDINLSKVQDPLIRDFSLLQVVKEK